MDAGAPRVLPADGHQVGAPEGAGTSDSDALTSNGSGGIRVVWACRRDPEVGLTAARPLPPAARPGPSAGRDVVLQDSIGDADGATEPARRDHAAPQEPVDTRNAEPQHLRRLRHRQQPPLHHRGSVVCLICRCKCVGLSNVSPRRLGACRRGRVSPIPPQSGGSQSPIMRMASHPFRGLTPWSVFARYPLC